MKKFMALTLCLCLALCAAGCAKQAGKPIAIPSTDAGLQYDGPPSVLPSPTEPFQPETITHPMHGIVMPIVQESALAEDGTVIFTRSYQQVQLILHGTDIEKTIAKDLEMRTNVLLAGASDAEYSARQDYDGSGSWNPYFSDVSYTPTRLDRSVLSLFSNHSSYSGGQHPSSVTESVTYDLVTGKALILGDILTEGYSGFELGELIAESLSDRASELYHDYEDVLMDRFTTNYTGLTSWYFSRTGLCFHFSPYDIAPYSAGTIIAELPYENLAGVLKDQYLPEPPINATGSIYAEAYMEEDAERFSFIAEVALTNEGTKILLYPDAAVTDVRIETGHRDANGSNYIPTSTVFAADNVGLGNAIAITADFSEDAPVLRLNYRSGGHDVSAFIVYDAEGDSVILSHG